MRLLDPTLAVGEVLDVFQRDHGVYLAVALRQFFEEDGERLRATCQIAVPFHGAGFGGLWFLPEKGSDVLCFFPGMSPDGQSGGGDLDHGLALGFLSSLPESIPTGAQGALSSTRMVFRGKDGVAFDVRVGGDFDLTLDAKQRVEVADDALRTVGGDDATTVEGEAALDAQGDVRIRSVGGALRIQASSQVTIEADTEITVKAPTIKLDASSIIEAAAGAVRKIVDERIYPWFLAITIYAGNHAHSALGSPPSTPAPTAPVAADTATEKLRGS